MNLLLATYSFYPYQWGGTEVYVTGLAKYLNQQGNNVIIIAGTTPEAFINYPVFYEDEQLKTVQYFFEEIMVVGVIMKNRNTTEIYSKFRAEWAESWIKLLQLLPVQQWDILHMHANTAAIGRSLIEAGKQHSKYIKIVASYHIPNSCVKGTLLYGNTNTACIVKPSVEICTACSISSKTQWPIHITKAFSLLIPVIQSEKWPTSFRLKFLVSQFISGFKSFDAAVDMWQVFSDQIKNILSLNGIPQKKIVQLRHGVNELFFLNDVQLYQSKSEQVENVFLYVGRFDKFKGFYTLLKSWMSLPENNTKVLWIMGENQSADPQTEAYIQQAAHRKDINWLGKLPQEKIAGLMQQAHCAIIPSEWVEIGPLVFHEAIAAGCDVITTNIGGCRELADRYSKKSQLYEPGNVDQLAKLITDFKYSGSKETPVTQTQHYQKVLQSYQVIVP